MSIPNGSFRQLRVFVVENHPDTLKYYLLHLQSAGHDVYHASSAAKALERIPQDQCDVLVCDLGLPDGSGWSLLTGLRENNLPHPPYAIAVSGFGSPADRAKSKTAGFRHHLLKPFDPDHLDAMLEEATRELHKRSGASLVDSSVQRSESGSVNR